LYRFVVDRSGRLAAGRGPRRAAGRPSDPDHPV